jgi:hypothetical protein
MKCKFPIALIALTFSAAAPPFVLHAQRLSGRIDSRARVVLRGSRNPRVDRLTSDGPVEDATRISGMTFRFRPTAAQTADLEQLLEDQQNPNSPLFHSWLTPEEYGERFGLGQDDFAKVTDWVVSQGFQVDFAAKSRTHISFSGTAAQVRAALGTDLHRYQLNGRRHFANTREVAIPSQIEPLVYSLAGLDDFPHVNKPILKPQVTATNGTHALTPGDLAVIYNLAPLFKKGLNGAGQKISIAGESTLNLQDIRDFRSLSGLPPSEPKVLLVPGSRDPGFTDAEGEALLDVQYAGAGAPGATIVYVYAADVRAALQYSVDQNVAPVLSFSFGVCETDSGSDWKWYRNLAQQAVAQGITWVASSGDTGAAACEYQLKDEMGISGVEVNAPASVPEVTGVGGTTFAEGPGKYWSNTNQADMTSAVSYIPEVAWNDTAPGTFLNATGGGASKLFARPSWQTGPGVPNDNARHVPDIAFTASGVHDPYLIVQTGGIVPTGGTSAGTPFFAGMLAVLNQHMVSSGAQARPGLGNINQRLYQLAQTARSVFHDVTAGNNIVPCKIGTTDCTTGRYGYNAGPGYDQVTGLGSIDAVNLIENWSSARSNTQGSSAVTATIDPSPVYQQAADEDGYAWFYTIRLSETAGIPTKLTNFAIDGYDLSAYVPDWFGSRALPAKGSLSVKVRARNLEVPRDIEFAFAGVDDSGQQWSKKTSASFRGPGAGSQKNAAMSLSSDPAVVVKVGAGDPDCSPDHPYGQTLNLRELNGVAVQLTKFLAGGSDYTDRIASWFSSTTLPASGALHAKLCWQLTNVPVTLAYEIDGVDGSGQQVQATVNVDFRNPFDTKSGAVRPRSNSQFAWPGLSPASESGRARAEAQRRAMEAHRTPSGMVVAPQPVVGSASVPLNRTDR